MKFNSKNHWVEEMTVGETVYIDFQELKHTTKGAPYIMADYNGNTIYANIGRWDETLFQEGHTYSMTCTKCEYNQNSKRYYLQYKFEDVIFAPTETTDEPLIESVNEFTPDIDIDANSMGNLEICRKILMKTRDEYNEKVQAIDFALERLR